jgi:HAD domain in Swiss Army Knife RNA repair proteins
MPPILFIDFDGVLHPQYEGITTPVDELFCHLPLFESVMREFPQVRIVISSTWRNAFTLEELRKRFSQDIGARIIGVTPILDFDVYHPTRREQEILAWLAETESSERPWVALDDAVWQFQQHLDRVVDCTWYVGLDKKAAIKLRNALHGLIADCACGKHPEPWRLQFPLPAKSGLSAPR